MTPLKSIKEKYHVLHVPTFHFKNQVTQQYEIFHRSWKDLLGPQCMALADRTVSTHVGCPVRDQSPELLVGIRILSLGVVCLRRLSRRTEGREVG